MSEQAWNRKAAPVARSVDLGARRAVVPGRVGAHLSRGSATGDQVRSFAIRGNGDWSAWPSRWVHVAGGRNRPPEWYRRLAIAASGISGLAVLVIGIARGVFG